jgi:hypothetical protein
VLFWFPVVGLVTAGIGLVLAIVGLNRSKPDGAGRSRAVGGIVTSSIGAVVGVLVLVLAIVVFAEIGGSIVDVVRECNQPGWTDQQIEDCIDQRLTEEFSS